MNSENATIYQSNFFNTDWKSFISNLSGDILIVGNPPWVTSSELSILNSQNLPLKSNFQNRRGIEAITGSGNFDISDWMFGSPVPMGITIACLNNRSVRVACRRHSGDYLNKQANNFSFIRSKFLNP